jgi:glycosyltransferase involved in cell wall biosynthesis
MKVLIVSEPGVDGVFRHVQALVRHLLASGWRVDLAYSDCRGSDQLQLLVAEVETAGGATLNLRVNQRPGPSDFTALIALWKFACQSGPDVIHAHSSKAGVLARTLRWLGIRARYFYTPHAYYRMHNPHGAARFFHLIERLFANVGTTICMTKEEASFAAEVIGARAAKRVIVANGVDAARFRPLCPDEKSQVRRAFGLPEKGSLLGTVGRFSTQKDPVTLYRGFIEAALPDVHLAHLGQGELEHSVDALLRGSSCISRISRIAYSSEPAAFYGALDGFILTSLYEGMSFAVLEALASNLPVILTRAPGNTAFNDFHFSHIYWAEPGDAASVAKAIREWHRESSSGAAPNHREAVLAELTETMCFDRTMGLYTADCGS